MFRPGGAPVSWRLRPGLLFGLVVVVVVVVVAVFFVGVRFVSAPCGAAATPAALPRCFVNSLTESPSVEVSAGAHDAPHGTQRLPAPTLRRHVGAVRSLVFVIRVQVPLRPLSVRFRFGFGLSAEVRS